MQAFAGMKHMKCEMTSQITDRHLATSLDVATLSILPDMGSLVRK